MKKLTILLTVLTAFFIFSCEEPIADDGIDQEKVISDGEWRITFFFDANGGEKAKNFANCNFSFQSGGTLKINRSNTNVEGTWFIGAADADSKNLNINVNDAGYAAINNSWIVSKISSNEINLMRFGPNGQETLVFNK